ncbi:MAG: cysteine hydrolase [Deltaproteobacteria bacterium]|nr:cysteine hydrolase [Deltaproteobacteria bacterium]
MQPAVIILDMSVGYGWAPGSYGYDLVAHVRRLKDAAHEAGVPVIHVNSMRRPADNVNNSAKLSASPGLDVIPELQPIDEDTIIYKRFTGGFSHNDLDYTLRTMGVDTVCLAGAATDNCVLWTAGEAHQYRYKVVVVEDCTIVNRPTAPEGRWQAAIDIMRDVAKGDILNTDGVVAKYFTKQ